MFGLLKRRRRAALTASPVPGSWLAVLEHDVPLYRRLPADDRRELQQHVQVLVAEKPFEGCGGLEITEPVTVTIAALASVLLLHRETDFFPSVASILVYPAAYVAPVVESEHDWIVTEGEEDREGEAWEHGTVILSWQDVLADAADPASGRNLVLHEFAHQLDMEDGVADGAPVLPDAASYADWARVMRAEFEQLQEDADAARDTLLDPYGATDPAEFFAVATECFFELPRELASEHADLYAQLRGFYRQDPAATFGEP